eukprot:s4243_g1.t1
MKEVIIISFSTLKRRSKVASHREILLPVLLTSAKCTGEAPVRLAETVRSPGRPFREEKASPGLGRASASTRPFRRDTDARDARRPMAPAPRAPAGGGASFRRSETDEGTQELTPATSKLQQITQWIRNEEERLSSSRLAGAGSA